MTTDPKKKREPRELSFSAAVDKLRRIDGDPRYDAETAADEAAEAARYRVIDAKSKAREAVFAKLPEAIREAAATEADKLGPIVAKEPEGLTITEPSDADLPRGATAYEPGHAARAARGRT